MIKVDVISGFLGAGKTTLIKKLYSNVFSKEKVALIENEFGEIGIDSKFLSESGINIKEINSGCICCSLVGNFEESIKEIVNTYAPDRIIIEPSGVGKLSDIVKAVESVECDLKLNIIATVADAGKVKMYRKNFGEFYDDQIKVANTIILSKVDKVKQEKIEESFAVLREMNETAMIVTTPITEENGEKILLSLEDSVNLLEKLLAMVKAEHHAHHHHHEHDEECCCGHDHEHHHHEHDEECCCGHDHEHHHHEHDEECCCGHDHEHHHHEHDEECCCGHDHEHHHHEHDEECCCGHDHEHHHHEHDEECCCGHDHEHHHHEHDEECCCGHDHEHHHHEHDEECCCGHHHHHGHHADEVFTSWGKETVKAYSKAEMESILSTLATREDIGEILRSKGIVKASDNDKWYYFDFVAGDFEVREGEPDIVGRVVVIGSHLNEAEIEKIFLG
ncbi:MAG: GTP-binding protein [Clostridiales bacterium]|nr:GTP-binding protein [Clostridiales bacterium]